MSRSLLFIALLPATLVGQNFDTVTVKAQPLRGGVYMLTGSGGNMGLAVGGDATFLVDDQFAPLTPKIQAAIASVTSQPVRFIINTHLHGDHTGGNENFAKAGALLVAHDNVRKRMSVEQFSELFNRRTPASPKAALPIVTFTDSLTFHINDDDLVALHVPPAHTDGDVVVHFTKADVIHMGDTFMTAGSYPLVDLSSGGNVNGFVSAADAALAVCTPNTMIIPGHGPLSDCAGLREWRNMIASVRERVQAEMKRGRTLDQIKAANLTQPYDTKWNNGFIKAPVFVEMVYRSLGGKP
ncbi:MAG TPA: MBL fold metallo-hydrolase [Gemmatimonadaceae bacterium]|nr:MBL fold metallo-hydrolase [Gemmatimonadaceae bacterium]